MKQVLTTSFWLCLLLISIKAQEPERSYQCPPGVICDPVMFDMYGKILWSDEKARLDNAVFSLRREPANFVLYLVGYGGQRGCIGEGQARVLRAKNHIVGKRGIPSSRVISIDGGFRDEQMVEVWLLPREIGEPTPTPRLDKSEVQLRDCKMKSKNRRKRGSS